LVATAVPEEMPDVAAAAEFVVLLLLQVTSFANLRFVVV